MSSPSVVHPARRSLITIALQESSSGAFSNPGANPQNSDNEITQSVEPIPSSSEYSAHAYPTESLLPLLERSSQDCNIQISSSENNSDNITNSDTLSSLERRNALGYLPANQDPVFCRRVPSVIQEIQDQERFAPGQQYNTPLEVPFIIKGFGNFKLENEMEVPKKKTLYYPPLSNAAYDYLNRSEVVDRRKPACSSVQLDGAASAKDHIKNCWASEQQTGDSETVKESASPGQLVALHTNWHLKPYDPEEGPFAYPPTSIYPFRSDFIDDVDKAVGLGLEPYEMCNKCGQRHIAWGPPIAMQDRDTCLSMLPEWFPKDRFERPWQAFKELMNDVVRYSEREQGRALDPDRKTWDKEFHEPTAAWRALGRHGGWWKCRTGLEDGQRNVPDLERCCRLCHREKTVEEVKQDQRIREDERRKLAVHQFIEHWIGKQLEKDKAFVKAAFNAAGE